MYGANYFGSLVFAAGLVVTSQTPIPPSTDGNGYGTAAYGQGVYGAGLVVTNQTPVPPAVSGGNGYACVYYGAGVYGAGLVVTTQVPVPPPGPPTPTVTRAGTNDANSYPVAVNRQSDLDADEEEEIAAIIGVWLNLK